MSDVSFLKMPHHSSTWDEPELPEWGCDSAVTPGWAHMYTDGTLHCNKCGWVSPPTITAYSPSTDRTYLTTDDLEKEESNGWVVLGIISRGKQTWPWVIGPFDNKVEAKRCQARARSRFKREENNLGIRPGTTARFSVRPAWKDDRN